MIKFGWNTLFPEINPNILVQCMKIFNIYIFIKLYTVVTLKNYSTSIWGAEKRTAIVVTIVKVVNIIRQNLKIDNIFIMRRGNAVLMQTIFCNNPEPCKYINLCSPASDGTIVSGCCSMAGIEWIILSKVLNRLLINLTQREQKISWILKHFE